MILTIGNIKGGVGKSTLACNIAVCLSQKDADVLLIDGDRQGSSSDFVQARGDILGDPGGQDNPSLRAGLISSDCVLVPVSPRSFETWALDSMVDLIGEASIANPNLKPFTVLNLAFPRGQDNDQTKNIIMEDYPSLTLVGTNIVQRKVFSDSIGQGLSVLEFKPQNPEAISEFSDLLGKLGFHQ